MNERIGELWDKAGGHYDRGNQHTWPQYTIDDPEKFAELIVQDCALTAALMEHGGRKNIGAAILDSFEIPLKSNVMAGGAKEKQDERAN